MPNGQAFDDALRVAADNPGLGIGIHLSLVGEQCVAPPASLGGLVDAQGNLPPSYPAFVKRFLLRRFTVRDIRTEIDAQITRALATGLPFTHIDSHQHLHMLPGVLDLVIDAAKPAGIHVLRLPFERDGLNPHHGSLRGMQLSGLTCLCRSSSRKIARAGLRHADAFWGLGLSGMLAESPLLETLYRLRPGINEIMCHPGESDPETRERYPWGYRWDDEAAALQSERVKEIIIARQICLMHFGELPTSP